MDRDPLSGSVHSPSPLDHLVLRHLGRHGARLAPAVSRGILMPRRALCLFALLSAATAPAVPPDWTVVWSDDFDGPAGSPPDSKKWTYEKGAGGWGNHEL